ncbi:membrane protein insertase YidC [Altererythrobacter sp. KTW20L]|uniref:membrane protein insertase YidC n=1 Tax=Altererythrobacter sp. KTW20L TaxID=2942210 RepID=UPI0020C0232B|nr:membrane protein insertase YidC [Altererythrobacter sp. KTW20L]MCL6251455.1 membrane protein insertase YidC [Altererythrobacter sp. KTW20L]
MNNQKNLILAVVLSLALILGWDLVMTRFFPQPEPAPVVATSAEQLDAPMVETELVRDLDTTLASTDRIGIDAPEVGGSINPVGARVDDIVLKSHRETVDQDSGPIRFFSPLGTPGQHFARFDWVGEGVTVPDAQTVWTVTAGDRLTQETPVSLAWDNGEGQLFGLTFAIDDKYMITTTQTLTNNAAGSVAVRPRGIINRTSLNASQSTWNVHSGPIAAVDQKVNFDWDYDDVNEEGGQVNLPGRPDWVGFTDIYWMSALIPQTGLASQASFSEAGANRYAAVLLYDVVTVPQGQRVSHTTQLFAGAKESAVLDQYEAAGVAKFGLAIDWGWFRWIAWPMWQVLIFLFDLVGNFGLAIICLTIIVRAIMFPIAQKQFASMAAMRAVQPKMKALQERYKDDKPQLQQQMAKLYKDEKINPLAGCLPIFLQIPIFFALYKVLLLAIEMRHEPFYLWIKDLSVPDPAHILNLFGLLPFDPPGFLAIGVMAVILGLTMWLQFKLNPAAIDPVQQQIFMIMPWVLMFVMAPFAAGLLLYWITSNILTLGQQKYLYSRHPQLKAMAEKEAAPAAADKG